MLYLISHSAPLGFMYRTCTIASKTELAIMENGGAGQRKVTKDNDVAGIIQQQFLHRGND